GRGDGGAGRGPERLPANSLHPRGSGPRGRGIAPEAPISGSQETPIAGSHRDAPSGRAGHAPVPGFPGVPRNRDPHADAFDSRRIEGVSRSIPRQPGALLFSAAVTANIQTTPDDFGVRPILPDRPLLPGRGPARRSPTRVHPD